MLRTLAIALILLLSIGVMLPFANSAHGIRQSAQVSVRRNHRYHSRAWWRRYRARLRKKRAAAALAHRNMTLGQPQNIPVANLTNIDLSALTLPTVRSMPSNVTLSAGEPPEMSLTSPAAPTLQTNATLPKAASRITAQRDLARMEFPVQSFSTTVQGAPSPMTIRKAPVNFARSTSALPVNPAKRTEVKAAARNTPASILPGQMNLSVVALSRPNPVFLTPREEKQMLGGTSVSDLRRLVIDKMIDSGGWVTNDYVREVNGSRVFVVTARTPRDKQNPEKTWTFYFTEADGRIYGLTTDAPLDSADRMSTEAERFINKLHSNSQANDR